MPTQVRPICPPTESVRDPDTTTLEKQLNTPGAALGARPLAGYEAPYPAPLAFEALPAAPAGADAAAAGGGTAG
jgi:hypothetical protein